MAQTISEFVHSGTIWQSKENEEAQNEEESKMNVAAYPCRYFIGIDKKRICCASTEEKMEIWTSFRLSAKAHEYKAAYCDTNHARCPLFWYHRKKERETN